MRPVPFTHPAAAAAFALAIGVFEFVQLRAGSALLRGGGTWANRGARHDHWTLPFVGALTAAGIGGAVALSTAMPGAAITPGIASIRWTLFGAGIALIVAGSLVRHWAVITLGRYFTLTVRIAEEQPVVTGGPYRWVRHPSYTGLLTAFVGIALALGNWLSLLLILVLPTVGVIRRIQVEDAVLFAGLGEPYRRYAAGKQRLLPGVW